MVTTDTGAKKISNNENWRNIFDAHNDSVDAYDDHIAKLDSGLAYVAVKSGNDWMLPSGKNASSGDYVIVNKVFGHATATLTGGSTAIVENTNWVAESAGALNSLNNNLTNLNERINKNALDSVIDISSYNSSNNQYTIPDDGYIQLTASYATPGVEVSCRINDYLSITIQSISASSTANVVFVRKGMKVYKSSTNGTLYYFKLI